MSEQVQEKGVEVTRAPYMDPAVLKIVDDLKAEIAASTSPASFARRTLKTEGELKLAYKLVQYIELVCTGKVHTVEPPRHHV